MLSGRIHTVYTGVALIKGEKVKTFSQETKVTFYDLSDDEINEYIASKECADKAGSYGIQGKGGLLVKGIDGDYFNVVGLPVARLKSCRPFSMYSNGMFRQIEVPIAASAFSTLNNPGIVNTNS